MFKGTVKRVYKRLKAASINRSRRLSDHRAVALAVHYTRTGLYAHSRLTGAKHNVNVDFAHGPDRAVVSPPLQGEEQGGDGLPSHTSVAQTLQSLDAAAEARCGALLYPSGHLMDFRRRAANA